MEYTKLLGKVTLTCDGKHDSSKEYDRLCLVYDDQYKSFISIKEVPTNISLANASYWQPISVTHADGEDIIVDDKFSLKFANKDYDPSKYSGMGRKILRKRVVNNANILTQIDFDSSDTIYIIQYEFDLQGNTITIPSNSILSFEGGKFINGNVVLSNTQLLPQGLNISQYITGEVSGTYKDGQIYYNDTKQSLIAIVNEKEIDLSTPNITNEYTRYNWIKYSPSQYGDQMTDEPQDDTVYIGIASNKEVAEPSNNPLDYIWARIKGQDGQPGKQGPEGPEGKRGPVGPTGANGKDGKDGIGITPNYNTFVFKQADTIPSKPTFTIPDPGTIGIDGWFRAPETIGRWWMSTGLVNGLSGVVTSWSDPVQCTAEDGLTNSYIDFKYAKNTDKYSAPVLDAAVREPFGWSDSVISTIDGEYLWMTNALIAADDTLSRNWSTPIRLTGDKGEQGSQGIPGTSQYLHIRYSENENGIPMTTTPNIYVGTAVTDSNTAPTEPVMYSWARFQGIQGPNGEQGIPGPTGEDGRTSYIHIKYSNDGGYTFTPATEHVAEGETPGAYLGQYADFIQLDSTNVADYKWSRILGEQGEVGPQGVPGRDGDGKMLYTWIAYANDANGSGINNDPAGKSYIGFAYNKENAEEIYDPSLYTWAKITGEQGVPGPAGEDGITTYTWIKYADQKPSASATTIYDVPNDNTQYIGIATNKTTASESTDWKEYVWSLFRGPQGNQGPQGVPGQTGTTLYTWIVYADDKYGNGMTNDPTGKSFIGIAYNQLTYEESYEDAKVYNWSSIKGIDGVPGPAGQDGRPSYTWIKYADENPTSITPIYDIPRDTTTYIGISTNNDTSVESTDYVNYIWSKFKGEEGGQGPQGVPGKDGVTLYTWIRYASGPNGEGISNSPVGKSYIGFAYNKQSAIESNNPADYVPWMEIKGEAGADGVPGAPGEDGTTLYTWIKYADQQPSASSPTIYDVPTVNTEYIGIAVNKTTPSETGSIWSDYVWSKFKGDKGQNGSDGATGKPGRIAYPAGEYNETVTYTCTEQKTPYIMFNGNYYVMNINGTWLGTEEGVTPQEDWESYGKDATWVLMEQYEALFTKLLIADGGTLGKFVFNGDYMISQQGTDASGKETNAYEQFNPSRPDSGKFQPNFYINGVTGKLTATNAFIKGSYKDQSRLVDNSEYYMLEYGGGNVSVDRNPDSVMGRETHSHISIGTGWFYSQLSTEKYWSMYNITNISDTPCLITNHYMGGFRAFCYLGKLYYGVILPNKYSSVTLRKVRVPENTTVEYDGKMGWDVTNEYVQICPNQNTIPTDVDWRVADAITYKMLQL